MRGMSDHLTARLREHFAKLPGVVLGALTLVACQLAGDTIARALAWPVPGAVLGMLLLLALLCLLGRVPSGLGLVAGALISHLMLPLIPLVAGISEHGRLLQQHGLAVLLLCAGGVVATTVCAALAYNRLDRSDQ